MKQYIVLNFIMFKLYNIVWQAVSVKLPAWQIPVGFARTRYHGCLHVVFLAAVANLS